MSKIILESNISGTGSITLKAPVSNNNITLDLPNAAGSLHVSGNPVTFPDGTQQYSASAMNFRNKIINGNFIIWQRGTTQNTDGYGSDDRWINRNVGSTKTHSRQSFDLGQTEVPGNPSFFSRTVVTSVAGANNYCTKSQRIEYVGTLAGKTATLSFWAKADATKNISIEFLQSFGTGGSPSDGVVAIGVTKLTLTSSWTKYTVTANIPSISGKVLGSNGNHNLTVLFWFEAGSNFNSRTDTLGHQSGTFDIAQVQVEEGSVATEFEQRPFAIELGLCQRYYEYSAFGIWSGYISGSTTYWSHQPYRVIKRNIPQVSCGIENSSAFSGPLTPTTNIYGIQVSAVSGVGTGPAFYRYWFAADAEL